MYRSFTGKERNKLYHSARWLGFAEAIRVKQLYLCYYCRRPNSKIVDHTVPVEVAPEAKFNRDNVKVVCARCHRLKTDWEHTHYGTGQYNELKPNAERLSAEEVKEELKKIQKRKALNALSMF